MRSGKNLYRVIAAVLLFFLFLAYWTAPRPAQPTLGEALRDFTLVIDPGHGGMDGGAISASGVKESKLNLAIALKLRDLCLFSGIPTVMVRDSDVSVDTEGSTVMQKKCSDLKNRAEFVNSVPKGLLLSIHQNHFSEEKYKGAQVFYADTPGSLELAELVQQSMRNCLAPKNHRKVKRSDRVYLMEHIRCTGILVECGFLSNREETERLLEDPYQKKIALSILHPIHMYRNGADTNGKI